MLDIILSGALWVLALYGGIEIIKTIYYYFTYTDLKSDGIYLIIAVKNQEEKIEGFMRSFLFRLIYGKEDIIKNVIVADLDSADKTMDILERLQKDYGCIRLTNWKECKEIVENIDKM